MLSISIRVNASHLLVEESCQILFYKQLDLFSCSVFAYCVFFSGKISYFMFASLLSSLLHLKNTVSVKSCPCVPLLFVPLHWFHCRHVCVNLCLLWKVSVHYMVAGGLCLQVCVKTSSPPTSSLRALNSCHKVSAIAQTCGGAERLPVSHLSVSVVSPVSHTLCLFIGPKKRTKEVCLVTHHISYGVWSPVEGGGEAASARPSGLAK